MNFDSGAENLKSGALTHLPLPWLRQLIIEWFPTIWRLFAKNFFARIKVFVITNEEYHCGNFVFMHLLKTHATFFEIHNYFCSNISLPIESLFNEIMNQLTKIVNSQVLIARSLIQVRGTAMQFILQNTERIKIFCKCNVMALMKNSLRSISLH